MTEWLSAELAMQRLGVRPQTLYAYVSRGRVQAAPDPGDPRRSRYRASDIAALKVRKARGRKAADVAQGAIAWGEPVLSSAITTIANGRLYYRGHDAARLAETETLESVGRLLRGGMGAPPPRVLRPPPPQGRSSMASAFAALAAQAAAAPPGRDRGPERLAVDAASLLDILADAVTGELGAGPIHGRLSRAWGCDRRGMDMIRRALVLMADHELNPSTFAARVAASTGASLAAAALAGLATLSGPLHGGMAEDVGGLIDDMRDVGARQTAVALLAHRPPAAGFGHPLYPDGDPRARALLGALRTPAPLEALRRALEDATGQHDNVDFALAVLARDLGLPRHASFALFAVARCAGWTAHAMEQIAEGGPIRPRARYSGPPPNAD
jgi:citrate synthase